MARDDRAYTYFVQNLYTKSSSAYSVHANQIARNRRTTRGNYEIVHLHAICNQSLIYDVNMRDSRFYSIFSTDEVYPKKRAEIDAEKYGRDIKKQDI